MIVFSFSGRLFGDPGTLLAVIGEDLHSQIAVAGGEGFFGIIRDRGLDTGEIADNFVLFRLPQKIDIDGLYVHRVGINYLFTPVNSKHILDSYDAEYPVVPPQEITVKNFSNLIFGDIYVSMNKAIFKVEITE